ncbi:sugar phosphate isomerase/epimerase family protein [Shinella sp.]|uniref:sugar phosphate isomerase/epimerase family protein n=1 Tax=Shinella sp. TaxID=1870904 RepID=UPI0029A0FAEF|nr:TIM barrel protein [Shinella sp.]MDX3973525.1 sugar phosphate isomerase/epimerase [Shinella sp.]
MQKLLIFQSLWAMERRHTDGFERSLEDNLHRIAEAGFDGINADWQDRPQTLRLAGLLKSHGLQAEAVCFPRTVDDLKPALELAAETGVHHLNIHPMARLRSLDGCVAILEGWQRLAEQVDFPVYVETHRDRMTTDLFFVLDILDQLPDLKLVGDLSHFLVGREFAWPISDENHAYIHRVLENCWALHGRVASREQVQIEIAFPHHRQWLELFLAWWERGFRSWQRRAAADATLAFVCELGPRPYAITGPDGNEMSDRWSEALMLRDLVRKTWDRTLPSGSAASNRTNVDA